MFYTGDCVDLSLIELETMVAEDYAKFYNHITEKAPTRAFSWLKVPILALSHLRHY